MAVKWGIIGTGRHPDLKIVPAMKLAENTEVVAVYSRDLGRAKAFAEKHNASTAYDSLDDLLKDSRIQAVFISSPNFLHAPYTRKAAEAGKHVLVEKPMALNAEEGLEMIRACEKSRVKLGVGFHLRHHPGHQKARELIRNGVLGMITLVQGQFCFPEQRGVVEVPPRGGLSDWWGKPEQIGGAYAIMGMGVHVFDLLQFLVEQPIVEVAAITNGQTPEKPLEDLAAVAFRMAGGGVGTVCCGRRVPDTENDAMIYGVNGRIALRDMVWEHLSGKLEVVSESVNTEVSFEKDRLGLYKRQIEAFNRAVQSGENFEASGWDGLGIIQIAAAVVESASKGQAVKIEPLIPPSPPKV